MRFLNLVTCVVLSLDHRVKGLVANARLAHLTADAPFIQSFPERIEQQGAYRGLEVFFARCSSGFLRSVCDFAGHFHKQTGLVGRVLHDTGPLGRD
jgi:hypothetical protein